MVNTTGVPAKPAESPSWTLAPVSESLFRILVYTLIPCLALLASSVVAVVRAPGNRLIRAFQRFAAGVVFAAVAVELLPRLHALDPPIVITAGFLGAVVLATF